MTEGTPDRSPDDTMDHDKEARLLLNPPIDSVQFSQNANSATNGQVVLPVSGAQCIAGSGGTGGGGVGMTKKELMKYANDPFWVRLRMTLFVLFWLVWFAMLFGAIAIIAFAPGCPATASLPWWKKASLLRVDVELDPRSSIGEQLANATRQLATIEANIGAIAETGSDGLLLAGLNPFLLVNSIRSGAENDTTTAPPDPAKSDEEATIREKFREQFAKLVETIHGDRMHGKLIVNLNLAETGLRNAWYEHEWPAKAIKVSGGGDSRENGSSVENRLYYIWRPKQQQPPTTTNDAIRWDYRVDKEAYSARRTDDSFALLDYANSAMRDDMRSVVIAWMRLKIDGIQSTGDFYVDSAGGSGLRPSADIFLHVHKWIKASGDNKAYLVADSEMTAPLVAQGEDAASFDLAPESAPWRELTKSGPNAINLKAALTRAFEMAQKYRADADQSFAAAPAAAAESNTTTTTKDGAAKPDVGRGWRSYVVDFAQNENNGIVANRNEPLSIAEASLAAFYMMPKSTPIVRVASSAAALSSNDSTKNQQQFADRIRAGAQFVAKLNALRAEHSECFMLGESRMRTFEKHGDEVFAISRHYAADKSGRQSTFVLVINFSGVSREVSISGPWPDPELFETRVVLTDTASSRLHPSHQDSHGEHTAVNFNSLKIEPKQMLLIQIAPK